MLTVRVVVARVVVARVAAARARRESEDVAGGEMAPNLGVEAFPCSSPLGCALSSSMSSLASATPCSAIPVDFALLDLTELRPSAFVFFLFLVVAVDILGDKAGGRIPDVIGSREGGVLLMIELGTAVLRPAGSISMPLTFAADVRAGEGDGDWVGVGTGVGAGVSPQDGERAPGGSGEGCCGDGD